MDFHLLPIFVLLHFVAAAAASNASLAAEVYWSSKLPNTPLPDPLKGLLHPLGNSDSVFNVSNAVNLYRADYGVGYWPKKLQLDSNAILYSTTIYFLHDKLRTNQKMRIVFTKSSNGSNFLPCRVADSIPFSSNNFSAILKHFSVRPTSQEAQAIKQTIKNCEGPNIKGEDKHCATCLESMVDFVASKFGTRVATMFNEVEKGEEYKEQEYTILKGVKKMGEHQVVCHKQRYPFAVYYCHKINATEVYEAPLMGANGSEAKAVVLCHTDTSTWNPNHFAFRVLPNVKPGGPPICHFVNSDTIVWLPN